MKLSEFLSEHWQNILYVVLGIVTLVLLWQSYLWVMDNKSIMMWVFSIIGVAAIYNAFPSKDGRFRTGYKGNDEFGFLSLLVGVVLLSLGLSLASSNQAMDENNISN